MRTNIITWQLLFALLVACSGGTGVERKRGSQELESQVPESQECSGALGEAPAYACLVLPDGMPPPTSSLAFALEGTVEEVVKGKLDDCEFSIGHEPTPRQQVWSARVRDGLREAWIGIAWDRALLSVGERVSIRFRQSGMALQAFESPLTPYAGEVRDQDDRLLYWIGSSHSVASLGAPPEIAVTDGTSCIGQEFCGRIERGGLRVSVDGREGEIAYGQRADFGPFTFVHAGNDHGVELTGSCYDWLVANVTMAAVRLPAENDDVDAGECDEDGGCAP